MLSLTILGLVLAAGAPAWHVDYAKAYAQARNDKKDLFIYFQEDDRLDDVFQDPEVRQELSRFVCLKVPVSYEYKGARLLDHSALDDLLGGTGLAIVSLHDDKLPSYQGIVSAHPFVRSHYGWVPGYGVEEVKTILDLPARATLTQRSMIYAIRVHPERPQSVYCQGHPAFLGHAERHCEQQASVCRQHHADILSASYRLQSEVEEGVGPASEVVAESWGNVVGGENVLEAAFSCVDAWRHSSGHWGAVSRSHRYFGYDIARGANNTWYATGIFAD